MRFIKTVERGGRMAAALLGVQRPGRQRPHATPERPALKNSPDLCNKVLFSHLHAQKGDLKLKTLHLCLVFILVVNFLLYYVVGSNFENSQQPIRYCTSHEIWRCSAYSKKRRSRNACDCNVQ